LHRQTVTYTLAPGQVKEIKDKMLNWAKQFSIFLFPDSNNYADKYGRYECLLAAGAHRVVRGNDGDLLAAVQQLHDDKKDWLFGHISYDYKNVLEPKLTSAHTANIDFPLLHFFIPVTVCYIDKGHTTLTIESYNDADKILSDILQSATGNTGKLPSLKFTSATSKEDYIATITKLRSHIADGDCYEINFCTEGHCANADVEPLRIFNALNALSPAPFAAYYRLNDSYMMCASPERYLQKDDRRIMSQPIKGTARRDADSRKDEQIKSALKEDIKERAENVMIVDLVRNDLSRCSDTGSVQVDELFGIYTFPQVHQMISTVSAKLKDNVPFTDAIRYSFPMGSMTGAPKFKVMQLIKQYEKSRRGLFAGTIGYITPQGNFDFNVIIRSLFYNASTKHLSYQTGGAITYDSIPAKEWEEMRLKAWALERIFS